MESAVPSCSVLWGRSLPWTSLQSPLPSGRALDATTVTVLEDLRGWPDQTWPHACLWNWVVADDTTESAFTFALFAKGRAAEANERDLETPGRGHQVLSGIHEPSRRSCLPLQLGKYVRLQMVCEINWICLEWAFSQMMAWRCFQIRELHSVEEDRELELQIHLFSCCLSAFCSPSRK